MSHDQNFKNLILDYSRQALEFFAPAEAAAIPTVARILPVRQEQLQERLGERFRELDVPLLVEWSDGAQEAILFILEEESDVRRFSIHRLAHYCLDLAELLGIERVVPVVIFLKPGAYPQELRLGGTQQVYLSFSFVACDLGRLSVEDYLHSRNIVARLNLPNLRMRPEQRVEIYLCAQEGLAELEPDLEKRLKYIDFIAQYANLSEAEQASYERRLAQSPLQEAIMGPVQKAREEGFREGMQQGMQQAIQQKTMEGIQLGLELKFGVQGLELMPEIRQIQNIDVLQNIFEGLKVAKNLEELKSIYQVAERSH